MNLANRIKAIRKYKGLKQKEVASRMKISQQAYSWIENNSTNVKIETLENFCKNVNIDPLFLLAKDIPVTHDNIAAFEKTMMDLKEITKKQPLESKKIKYTKGND